MKSPFRKVRGLGLHKHDKRHRHGIQRSSAQLDELSQASQVLISFNLNLLLQIFTS